LAVLAILAREFLLFIFAADHFSTAWCKSMTQQRSGMGAGISLAKIAKIAKAGKEVRNRFISPLAILARVLLLKFR
jgi:hypothetical protein